MTLMFSFCDCGYSGDKLPFESIRRSTDEFFKAELEKPGRVGFSVAVACEAEIVVEKGLGIIDLEHESVAKPTSLFRIGSLTKQFTAALILRYVEQGKLRLDDLVSKHTSFPTGTHTVTVRHLLNHTSGIMSYTNAGESFTKLIPLERSAGEVLGLVKDAPLSFEPGSDFSYSNTNYFLLGIIIETVGGKPFGEILSEELLTPLNLSYTRYDSNSDIIRGRAQGYALYGERLVNDGLMGISQPYAAGGMLSTAGDLVRWQIAISSGKFITEENYRLMNTPPKLPEGIAPYFKYGFGRIEGEWEGELVHFHGGGINGFTAFLGHFPRSDMTIAVLANSEALDATAIAKELKRNLQPVAAE